MVAATVVLQLFYGLVRTDWPSSYYSSSDLLSRGISRTWHRYALFRFGPVLIASAVVAAAVRDRTGAWIAALLAALLHGFATSGRALLAARATRTTTPRQVAVNVVILLGMVPTGLSGALLGPRLARYLPGLDKYVEVLATGVVAAITYAYIVRATSRESVDLPREEVLRSQPQELLRMTIKAAVRHRVDQHLALAILVTEGYQRPPWLRTWEQRAGRVGLARTFGPFQNLSAPGSARRSVEAAMAELAGATLPRRDGGGPRSALLNFQVERHNRSHAFREACTAVYWTIMPPEASGALGRDGSPTLQMFKRLRSGATWLVEGDVSDDVEAVWASASTEGARPRHLPVTAELLPGPHHRRLWRLTVPLEFETVTVFAGTRPGQATVFPEENAQVLKTYLAE